MNVHPDITYAGLLHLWFFIKMFFTGCVPFNVVQILVSHPLDSSHVSDISDQCFSFANAPAFSPALRPSNPSLIDFAGTQSASWFPEMVADFPTVVSSKMEVIAIGALVGLKSQSLISRIAALSNPTPHRIEAL